MDKLDLKKSRSLIDIKRLNFEKCNHPESVADHSYYAGIIAYQIASLYGEKEIDKLRIMKYAMMHDLPEAVIGDIPYLTRRALGKDICRALDHAGAEELGISATIPKKYRKYVEFADILEFAMYLKEELRSGNIHLTEIYAETLGRLRKYLECEIYTAYICEALGMSKKTIIMASKEMIDAIKH